MYVQPYGESHPIWSQGGDEFNRANSQDVVTGVDGRPHSSDQATIWRWREAYQNDFAARMHWTVQDFKHANHNPMLFLNGQAGTAPIEIEASAGQTITLDASGSNDPDGQTLSYRWLLYPQGGAHRYARCRCVSSERGRASRQGDHQISLPTGLAAWNPLSRAGSDAHYPCRHRRRITASDLIRRVILKVKSSP